MNIYDFNVITIDGKKQSLAEYKNKTLLIVNVASKCGFTPQYQALQSFYEKYRNQSFEILAFPCNQFNNQEPADNTAIKDFCEKQYHISFPLFEKIKVNGHNAHPLYNYLKKQAPGILHSKAIKWNFTKFLVNHEGKVIRRFAPVTSIEKIEDFLKHEVNLIK